MLQICVKNKLCEKIKIKRVNRVEQKSIYINFDLKKLI